MRRHVRRQLVHERDLDEDERLVGKRRVEEREAAPVALEPALEVGESVDLVHRLVGDQLLEDCGRGLPVDAAQLQEAAVEPGPEQMGEVEVHGGELRVLAALLEQCAAQLDQHRRSAGRHVHAPEYLLARRFRDSLQRGEVGRRGIAMVGLGRPEHGLAVGREVAGEQLEEMGALGPVQAPVERHCAARQRGPGGFAPLRDQRAQHFGQAFGAPLRRRAADAGGGERLHDPADDRSGARHGRPPLDAKRSRSRFFCTLPMALRGSSSTMKTRLGTLKFASRPLSAAMTCASLAALAPGLATTTATTASPKSGCGTPTTADSRRPRRAR